MQEVKITIEAEELTEAIRALAAQLGVGKVEMTAVQKGAGNQVIGAVDTVVSVPTTPAVPPAPAVPVVAPTTPAAVPVAPAVPVSNIPTSAPVYTLDMLATAGATLIDAGKMEPLRSVLSRFGVDNLTALDPSQYGAMATELRALGAQI